MPLLLQGRIFDDDFVNPPPQLRAPATQKPSPSVAFRHCIFRGFIRHCLSKILFSFSAAGITKIWTADGRRRDPCDVMADQVSLCAEPRCGSYGLMLRHSPDDLIAHRVRRGHSGPTDKSLSAVDVLEKNFKMLKLVSF